MLCQGYISFILYGTFASKPVHGDVENMNVTIIMQTYQHNVGFIFADALLLLV